MSCSYTEIQYQVQKLVSEKFGVQLDFDCEGDPPTVYIANGSGTGMCYLEVFESPTLKSAEWSWEAEDWQPGPLALELVGFMNSREVAK